MIGLCVVIGLFRYRNIEVSRGTVMHMVVEPLPYVDG